MNNIIEIQLFTIGVIIGAIIVFFIVCPIINDMYAYILDTKKNLKARRIKQMEKIKIKYFDKEIDKLRYIGCGKSNWIDLRSAETVHLKKGEFHLIPLGVGMKLPDGYEANIVPRSSTYKNFKILQTNCFAVIDNSYSGDADEWKLPVIAMEDTVISKNDRICQFRINKIQPEIEFEEVEHLDETSRGGFGSTGKA